MQIHKAYRVWCGKSLLFKRGNSNVQSSQRKPQTFNFFPLRNSKFCLYQQVWYFFIVAVTLFKRNEHISSLPVMPRSIFGSVSWGCISSVQAPHFVHLPLCSAFVQHGTRWTCWHISYLYLCNPCTLCIILKYSPTNQGSRGDCYHCKAIKDKVNE